MSAVLRDLGLLVPAFRERRDLVETAMTARGHHYVTNETLRSLERSAQLVKEGTSQVSGGPSMHCYGIAEDGRCGHHGWDCAKHECDFFEALHQEVLKVGLTRVRLTNKKTGVKYWDQPHMQAIPVSMQPLIRSAAREHIDTLVRSLFAGLVPR